MTAVIVDNGEENLERCVASLRDQTIRVRIVLAPGPKSDLSRVRELVDKVYPVAVGIGRARVNAILGEEDEVILSCDSDTRYAENYAELAVQDLSFLGFVKAGMILPAEPPTDIGLALLEQIFSPFGPYEYAIAMRRRAFLDSGAHLLDYDSCPRSDIGLGISRRAILLPDPRMVVWTRLPTKSADVTKEYIPAIAASLTPFVILGGVVGLNELDKWRRSYG